MDRLNDIEKELLQDIQRMDKDREEPEQEGLWPEKKTTTIRLF